MVGGWSEESEPVRGFPADVRARLGRLDPQHLPQGSVLFRPGDAAGGFVIVLAGRVGVYLVGPTGREILLYSVSVGETCVQTTLGLMGGDAYSGEAVAETDLSAVIVPKGEFMRLMNDSPDFRGFVFQAFAQRLQTMMHLLEKVAFLRVDTRLAEILMERMDAEGRVAATHQELAVAIGTAREVVSRTLERFRRDDLIEMERGQIVVRKPAGLRQKTQ